MEHVECGVAKRVLARSWEAVELVHERVVPHKKRGTHSFEAGDVAAEEEVRAANGLRISCGAATVPIRRMWRQMKKLPIGIKPRVSSALWRN